MTELLDVEFKHDVDVFGEFKGRIVSGYSLAKNLKLYLDTYKDLRVVRVHDVTRNTDMYVPMTNVRSFKGPADAPAKSTTKR